MELDFNCRECDSAMKAERGCTKRGIVPFYLNGEQYFKCPIRLITPISWEYVRAYGLYEKGYLPNGAGWNEESEKYLSAMTTIGNELTKQQNEKMKKMSHKKPMNKKGRRK